MRVCLPYFLLLSNYNHMWQNEASVLNAISEMFREFAEKFHILLNQEDLRIDAEWMPCL